MPRIPTQKFPPRFARSVDFIPSIQLQAILNPERETCGYEGVFSQRLSGTDIPDKGQIEHDGILMTSQSVRQPQKIQYPVPDKIGFGTRKRIRRTYLLEGRTPEDILKSVIEITGKEVDVIERISVVKETTPTNIESLIDEGVESVYLMNQSRGLHLKQVERHHFMNQRVFIRPTNWIRDWADVNAIIPRHHKSWRKIRSNLLCDGIVTSDARGWTDNLFIGDITKEHPYGKTLFKLLNEISKPRPWQDMMLPRPFTKGDVSMFMLLNTKDVFGRNKVVYPINIH